MRIVMCHVGVPWHIDACAIAWKHIAMQNASPETKESAHPVSQWTNDQDTVAREWNRLKALHG